MNTHPVADQLENSLKRRLAEVAASDNVTGVLSGICNDLVQAIRDLEDIRGGSPQRLSDILKRGSNEVINVQSIVSDLATDELVDVLDYLEDYAQLSLSTLPKFWVQCTPQSQELIPLGLIDLGQWVEGQRYFDSFIIANATSNRPGPVDIFLGNRFVGTARTDISKILRSEALATGSNLVTIPCAVIMQNNTIWSIVVDGHLQHTSPPSKRP